MEGLPGKVYLHLLPNDGVEVQRFLVLLAPLGVVFTELPVGIEFQAAVPTPLGVTVPENHQRHALARRHFLLDGDIVRRLVTEIPSGERRVLSVDRLGDPVICDPLRERIVQRRTSFECPQKVIDAGLAGPEHFGYLPATHSQGEMPCDDVLVI